MATNFMRAKVSKKKRRFIDKKNGFDLDLSYITPNLIAMGFPSEGVEGAYRNPYSEVIRFLDLKHKDRFKVYNLCSERGYDSAKFYNRVGLFPFDDHNAPPFELIEQFCADVKTFLDQDENNLAVVHCKAGKGRTGLMICCYLIYTKEWNSADEAMAFYAAMRTYNKKGVTIPSQIRYIHYFDRYRKSGIPYKGPLSITRIVVHGMPNMHKVSQLGFIISTFTKDEVFSCREKAAKKERKKKKPKSNKESSLDDDTELEVITFDCNHTPLVGDVKVTFIERSPSIVGRIEETPICWFWFNTGFIDNNYVVVQQSEIDKANKDKSNKTFPKGFHVEVYTNRPEGDEGAPTSEQSLADSQSSTSSSSQAVGAAKFSNILEQYPSLNNI